MWQKFNYSHVILFICVAAVSTIDLRQFSTDINSNDIPECNALLSDLALSASNFTLCSLNYSRPIRVCEMCFMQYYDFKQRYDDVTTVSVNGTQCRDVLLNVDRLEIVETYHRNLKSIWDQGSCEGCLDDKEGNHAVSSATKTFFRYLIETETCIKTHKIVLNQTDEITCKQCMDGYLTLNTMYKAFEGSSQTTSICMDIVDSMNATRLIWSSVLQCCKLRQSPELIFIVCLSIIASTPLVFYLLARFCTRGSRPKLVGQSRLRETFTEQRDQSSEASGHHSQS